MAMGVGIKSVSYVVPEQVRTNAFWREKYPEMVARAEKNSAAKLWAKRDARAPNTFDRMMEPYLGDPFRGAVERRVLADHESGLTMETQAAREALEAVRWSPSEVDLVLVSSFLPDQFGPGNAAYLVKELGTRCPGINLESACSSALVSLNTAIGLVQAGQYRNALVVTSCSYSRMAPEDDAMSWISGDGAGAILVGEVPEGRGWLAQHTVNTSSTCGAFRVKIVFDPEQGAVPRVESSKDTARIINETGEPVMRDACFGALEKAGLGVDDVACFVVNTPTAWYADFACAVTGIARDKTVSTYERFANVGTALLPINLHESLREGLVHDGDYVLLYSVGSVSTAVATVLRWSDAMLGPAH